MKKLIQLLIITNIYLFSSLAIAAPRYQLDDGSDNILGTSGRPVHVNCVSGCGIGTVTSISTTAPLSGGPITSSGTITTSMATNKLIGRGSAGTGVMQEITLGTGLSLSGTTLNSSGGSSPSIGGTVTSGTNKRILFIRPDSTLAQSDNLQWDEDNKLLTVDNPAYVVTVNSVVSGGTAIQDESDPLFNLFSNGSTWIFHIYAYKDIGSIRVFSDSVSFYVISSIDSADADKFQWNLGWDAVSGASGYIVQVAKDDQYGITGNYYFDVATNSMNYNGPFGGFSGTPFLYPSTPYTIFPLAIHTTGSLKVDGKIISGVPNTQGATIELGNDDGYATEHDGSILVKGQTGTGWIVPGTITQDSLFLWYPRKGAIVAGASMNISDSSIGEGSANFGSNNICSGLNTLCTGEANLNQHGNSVVSGENNVSDAGANATHGTGNHNHAAMTLINGYSNTANPGCEDGFINGEANVCGTIGGPTNLTSMGTLVNGLENTAKGQANIVSGSSVTTTESVTASIVGGILSTASNLKSGVVWGNSAEGHNGANHCVGDTVVCNGFNSGGFGTKMTVGSTTLNGDGSYGLNLTGSSGVAKTLSRNHVFGIYEGTMMLDNLTASTPIVADSNKDLTSGSFSGNTTKVVTNTGTNTNGNLIKWDSNGNAIDAGITAFTIGNVALTNQGADITTTNLATVAGVYRVSYSLQDTTSDIAAGAATLTISYTDGAGATTATANQILTGTGRALGSAYVQLASGNLTYSISHTGIFGSAKYALYITTERLD